MKTFFTAEGLNSALQALGARTSMQLFDQLRATYSEQGRHYHTDVHIGECLRHLKRYAHLAVSLPEIELALWFHDLVYDTHAKDNEEQSAASARRELAALGVPAASIERVTEMILATKTHQAVHPDTALMVDVDLGILGAAPTAFERYDQAIRQEYIWVPEPEYRAGRAKVLSSFLDRQSIFMTPDFRDRYELQARENLRRKIAELRQ